jgi:hypothetical protein
MANEADKMITQVALIAASVTLVVYDHGFFAVIFLSLLILTLIAPRGYDD